MSPRRVNVRVDLNPGFAAELSRESETQAHMAVVANAIAEAAAENTPVKTGSMAGGWTASAGEVDGEGAFATVSNTDGGAVPMEVGSINNPPHAMCSRAVQDVGLDLRGGRT